LAVNPVSTNQIYAGTGHGVAISTDGGATWTNAAVQAPPTAAGLAPPIAIGHIFALALITNPLTLYAGTSQGVYQSTNAGTANMNWTLASTGIVTSSSVPYVQAFTVNPGPPLTFYAGTSLGVFSSTNPAINWVTAGLYGFDVRALAIDTNPPVTLYAATADYGVWRSTDQGSVWTAPNIGLTNFSCLALAIDPQTHSNLYVGTTDGLFKSTNSGNNWTLLFSLSNLGYTNGLQINAFAFDTNTPAVYAGTDQGTFKSTDGGMSWNPVTNGLSALPTYALAVSPADPALLYAGTIEFSVTNGSDAFLTTLDTATGSLLTSTILSGDGTNEGWAVAVDAADNVYIVGGTTSTNFPTAATAGFLSATNNGSNDVFVAAINANASAFLYSAYLGGATNDFGYGIAVDPAGNAYVVGQTFSTDFPVVGARQPTLAGGSDAFLAKIIQVGTTPSLAATLLAERNLQLRWLAFSPYVLETATNLSAGATWTAVPQTLVVPTNGWDTVTLPATNRAAFFRLYYP
jgi:hypothetical protein